MAQAKPKPITLTSSAIKQMRIKVGDNELLAKNGHVTATTEEEIAVCQAAGFSQPTKGKK